MRRGEVCERSRWWISSLQVFAVQIFKLTANWMSGCNHVNVSRMNDSTRNSHDYSAQCSVNMLQTYMYDSDLTDSEHVNFVDEIF
jgi:hypothetical protein